VAGLTRSEAALRLSQDGPNVLPGTMPKTLLAIVLGVVTEPMFVMLLVAGGVYFALGDRAEAVFLLTFVFVVIGITLMQERKTQRALESLRDLSAPRAMVIRDGEEVRVAGREVVRGDALVLHEGDRVAADALLIEGHLSVNESLLTGEAVPVTKLPSLGWQCCAWPTAVGSTWRDVILLAQCFLGSGAGAERTPPGSTGRQTRRCRRAGRRRHRTCRYRMRVDQLRCSDRLWRHVLGGAGQGAGVGQLDFSIDLRRFSTQREKRSERWPRRHAIQAAPASTAKPTVITKSSPGFATAPLAPTATPNRHRKNITFQNRATRG
jgi:hypothetical protein